MCLKHRVLHWEETSRFVSKYGYVVECLRTRKSFSGHAEPLSYIAEEAQQQSNGVGSAALFSKRALR